MEGVSNNVAVNRPNYHATAKGAIGGAAVGAAFVGAVHGAYKYDTLMLKKADNDTKRVFIDSGQKILKRFHVDTSKTTISKVLDFTIKEFKKPSVVAKIVAVPAAIGATIGFGVDMVKNSAKRLADKTKKA